MTKNVIACIAVRCPHIENHEYLCPSTVDISEGGRENSYLTNSNTMDDMDFQ